MAEFSEEERGIEDRGLDQSTYPAPRRVDYLEAYRGPRRTVQEMLEEFRGREREKEELKEQFKAENPTWAFSSEVQNEARKQGIIFTQGEITSDMRGWLGTVSPAAWADLVIEIIEQVQAQYPRVKDDDPSPLVGEDTTWQAMAFLVGLIVQRAVAKKVKAKLAQQLLAEGLERTGLSSKIRKKLAFEVLEIQRIASEVLPLLIKKNPNWQRDDNSRMQMGKDLEREVNKRLKRRNRTRGVKVDFQVRTGVTSGARHRGPAIDYLVSLSYKSYALVELKLSASAITPFRDEHGTRWNSQPMSLIHSADSGIPAFYVTPTEVILVPGSALQTRLSGRELQLIVDQLLHLEIDR